MSVIIMSIMLLPVLHCPGPAWQCKT